MKGKRYRVAYSSKFNVLYTEECNINCTKNSMMNSYSIIGECFLALLAVEKLLANRGHIESLTRLSQPAVDGGEAIGHFITDGFWNYVK